MASTYVNDLRLNELATGDGAGTWGTTTNTNLELIGEAFSFGTEAITTNADTHTTTIADGATDPGRSMYLKYTGTLDSACTITIGPNTVSKMWFIENGTSGSQNIIISQGSGANITIPAGDVKVIYSDGAGSGAAVVDAFASLSVVDLKVQDDLTVTDDLIVNGDIDLEGNMDVNGSLETDALSLNGTTVTSTAAEINLLDGSSANTVVNSKAVIYGSSGEVAGTLSTAAQPNITSLGTLTGLTTTGDINFGDSDKAIFGAGSDLQIFHDGSNSIVSDEGTGQLHLKGNGRVAILNSADNVTLANFDSGGASRLMYAGSQKLATTSTGIDVTGTATMDGLTVDGTGDLGTIGNGAFNQAAALGFQSDRAFFGYSSSQSALIQSGSSKGVVIEVNNDTLDSGTRAALFASNGDISFYDDTGTSQALFWDASAESLGIGTTSPYTLLELSSTDPIIRMTDSNGVADKSTYEMRAIGASGSESLEFRTVNDANNSYNKLLVLAHGGNVGIGTDDVTDKLTINADAGDGITFDGISTSAAAEQDVSDIKFINRRSSGTTVKANIKHITNGTANGSALTFGTTTGSGATEKMRIDSSGNVGIGTDSPEFKFHVVEQASYGGIKVSGGNAPGITFEDDTDNAYSRIVAQNDGELRISADVANVGSGSFMSFRTAGDAERMRLDSSGNVGIGTTSVSASRMQIKGANNTVDAFGDGLKVTSNNESVYMQYSWAGMNANDSMKFGTAGSERMRIDSSGNLLMGVTSISDSSDRSYGNAFAGTSADANWKSWGTGSHTHAQFRNATSVVGSITTTSSATTYNTSSDARLKDITGEARGLEVINELNPVAYNWKADGKADEGLIAQEVLNIVPNAVSGSEEEMYQMDYSKLVVHLVAGMKEQQELITTLQAEVALLKEK